MTDSFPIEIYSGHGPAHWIPRMCPTCGQPWPCLQWLRDDVVMYEMAQKISESHGLDLVTDLLLKARARLALAELIREDL